MCISSSWLITLDLYCISFIHLMELVSCTLSRCAVPLDPGMFTNLDPTLILLNRPPASQPERSTTPLDTVNRYHCSFGEMSLTIFHRVSPAAEW